jgi:hypothetical protein
MLTRLESGVHKYFLVSVLLWVVNLLSNLAAFAVVESVGRRTLLVPGLFVLTIVCLLLGIMGCLTTQGSLWFSVVCVFLWYVTISSLTLFFLPFSWYAS